MDNEDDNLFLGWEDDSAVLFENFDDVPLYNQSHIDDEAINQVPIKGETFFKQMDEDLDYAFALSLQTQYEEEVKENILSDSKKIQTKDSQSSKPLSIVDDQWELIDPHPDIHVLFQEYDKKFFYGKLKQVEVKWSQRMTVCAGVCSYEGRGGLCSVRLSVPLLKLRPRKDLVETLLHEMIHAYLFVTHNNKDRNGHGPEFLSHMHRINKETGTKITVYHSFHDEVDLYRQHWWKCNGPCKNRRPFFGVLKRTINRPPGPTDTWWAHHAANCGGTFVKIKEPDNYGKKISAKRKAPSDCKESSSDIRNFIKSDTSQNGKNKSISSSVKTSKSPFDPPLIDQSNIVTLNNKTTSPKKLFTPFQGSGHKLGGSSNGFNVRLQRIQENSLNKAIMSSSSSNKALDKSTVTFPKAHKVPKLSSSQRNVFGDQKPSTSVSRNLVQSPIERFLSPQTDTKKISSVKKDSFINQSNVQESDVLKVSCPVCFILVKEQEINSHLDTCLPG